MSHEGRVAEQPIELEELVGAWVHGWTRSRETSAALAHPDHWYIRVDGRREIHRWVLRRPEESALAAVLVQVSEPSCVKFAGDPQVWEPRFGHRWEPDEPAWFMTTALEPPASGEPALLAGYRIETAATPGLVTVDVLDDAGGIAAWGRAGVHGDWLVPDQINTLPAYRRRGLGSAVMTTLGELGRRQGARRAVLSASTDGRALYTSLGWREASPMVAAYWRP